MSGGHMPKAGRVEICIADPGFVTKVRPMLILSGAHQNGARAVVTCVVRTTSTRDKIEVPH